MKWSSKHELTEMVACTRLARDQTSQNASMVWGGASVFP